MAKTIAKFSGRFACRRCRTVYDLLNESSLECPRCDGLLERVDIPDVDDVGEDEEGDGE